MALKAPPRGGARGREDHHLAAGNGAADRSTADGDGAELTPEPETVRYSRGTDPFDAWPEQRSAPSFEAFAEAVLSDRSRAKGQTWISAPFKPNSDGRHHRCAAGALPRRFLALDLDGSTPNAVAEICMYLGVYRGFGYLTASNTTKSPHARFILETSRPVDRADGIRLGEALQRQIEVRVGSRAVKLDPSVYRGEQPLYGPLVGAEVMRYGGDPIDVDAVLALAPKEEPRVRRADEPDPYRAALLDRGLVLRELGPGKDAIACPFAEDHTEATSDTSTAYFWPRYGGYQWGGIHCLHAHCADRNKDQRLYIEKLGLDPRAVWRGQADDLPPLEAYAGDAAREAAGNGAASEGACVAEAVYRRLSDIQPKPIRWLWRGRIARGKLTIVAGHPDLGKSQVAASMAAVVTTGGTWPVDRTPCEAGSVIILSAEDDAEDTIRPRLEAAGADLKRIFILDAIREPNRDGTQAERLFNLTADIDRLADLTRKLGDVSLIHIDPVTAYLGGVDSHKNSEVRGVLAPLAAMAAEREAAIVCVSHLNKAGGTEAMLRVMGSLGFVAAARAAYLVAKDPDDDTRRLFLPMKNNLAEDRGGLAYRVKGRTLGGGIETSCVEWDADPVTMTADEAMAPAGDPEEGGKLDEERSKLDEAMEWLGKLLKDGSVDSKEIRAAAKQSGIAQPTVDRAKTRLGVKAIKATYSGGWRWSLPEHIPPEHDTVDHLGKLTPLKPSCDAGSTEGAQASEQNESLDHLRSNLDGARVPGDHEAEDDQDRQGVGDDGQIEGAL